VKKAMSLTGQDFVEIARILATTNASEETVKSTIAYCKFSNPRFNETKFRNYIKRVK
jgi:hypothetical protein